MKSNRSITPWLALAALATFNLQPAPAVAQTTAFSYQGRLNNNGTPANGIYDLRFAIYDSTNSPGTLIAGPLTNSATGVTDGLFTVTLDFGPGVFTGPARWLELDVRTNGPAEAGFTPLLPRQPLLPVPYAVMANTASNLLGPLPAAQLSGTLPASALAGYSGAVTLTNAGNCFYGSFLGSFGGNATNLMLWAGTNSLGPMVSMQQGTNYWVTVTGNAAASGIYTNVGYVQSGVLAGDALYAGPNGYGVLNDSSAGDLPDPYAGGVILTNSAGTVVAAASGYPGFPNVQNFDISGSGCFAWTTNWVPVGFQVNGTLSANSLSVGSLSATNVSGLPQASAAVNGIVSSNIVSTAQVNHSMRLAANRVPLMGYLSGTLLDCSENTVVSIAQQLNTSGLAVLGYNMVGMDAGWSATTRTSSNALQSDPTMFPHGIPWLVSVLKTNGCYLGLYLSSIYCGYDYRGPDQGLCPASAYADGYQLATWGIRNLKVDRVGQSSPSIAQYALEQMAAGLDDGAVAAGLDYPVCLLIVMSNYPLQSWMPDVVNGIYAMPLAGDPDDSTAATHQQFLMAFLSNTRSIVGPGCQYSPEGIGHPYGSAWWNTNYARADMGVFCLAPFPLDLSNLPDPGLIAYTNRGAIQINQDPLVLPGMYLSTNLTGSVLYRPLANGDVALGLWNWSTNSNTSFTVDLSTVPCLRTNCVHVQDVFDHSITYAGGTLSATVNTGGFNLYRLTP